MVIQYRVTRFIPLLCALLACDTNEFELQSEDEVVDEDDRGQDDDEASQDDEASKDDEASRFELTTAPGGNRNATCAAHCLAQNFAFCFWNGTGCSGSRIAIPGGTEFDFTYANDLRSLHKRDGTVRVALYLQNGKCIMSVPPGKISLTVLPQGTRRAKWNAACPS